MTIKEILIGWAIIAVIWLLALMLPAGVIVAVWIDNAHALVGR